MRQRVLAAALTATLAAGSAIPAYADGRASTRNIVLLGGVAAGIMITNYNHKVREKRAEEQQVLRRQEAYRDWFYQRYGYYPTYDQFRAWYQRTYGRNPD